MSNLNALRSKFDLDVKKIKVNQGSSFEQNWKAQHPKCDQGHQPSGSGEKDF